MANEMASPHLTKLPKIRDEWYQTDNEVVISVFIKNCSPENLHVDLAERSVSLSYHLLGSGQTGSEGYYGLDPLAQQIDVQQSSWTVLQQKVELRLKKKAPGVKWPCLESQQDGEQGSQPIAGLPSASTPSANTDTRTGAYPSSSRKKTNWDQLAQTVDKEESEALESLKDPNAGGDRALNELFQKLYAGATDEQKRAMMKSYTESNGTALSTDWAEVKSKKVETRPPESMVAKPWNK